MSREAKMVILLWAWEKLSRDCYVLCGYVIPDSMFSEVAGKVL